MLIIMRFCYGFSLRFQTVSRERMLKETPTHGLTGTLRCLRLGVIKSARRATMDLSERKMRCRRGAGFFLGGCVIQVASVCTSLQKIQNDPENHLPLYSEFLLSSFVYRLVDHYFLCLETIESFDLTESLSPWYVSSIVSTVCYVSILFSNSTLSHTHTKLPTGPQKDQIQKERTQGHQGLQQH